jgi:hypothetical protein
MKLTDILNEIKARPATQPKVDPDKVIEYYIEDLKEKNLIVVSWPENKCRVAVPFSVDAGLVPYLGEFECKKEK